MKLLLYGLQRSGTNYLESLLKRAYDVEVINNKQQRSSPSHKHFRLYDQKTIIPEAQYANSLPCPDLQTFEGYLQTVPDYYLVLSKEPISWLRSYQDWAQACGWPAVGHHYLEEYNLFYGRWLAFAKETERIVFLRYVDLLGAKEAALAGLEARLGLRRRWLGGLRLRRIRRVEQSADFSAERRAYYLNQAYLDAYDPAELEALERLVDAQVRAGLGYGPGA